MLSNSPPPPIWNVYQGNWSAPSCFSNTWPSGIAVKTCVRLTFDDDAFRASFLVLNDPVQGSAYTDCNEPIFRQEVVEMFIGNDTSAKPEHYWEIDVAPSGVAWMGYDSNPGGDRRNFSSVAYPCDTVDTRVLRHPTEDAWEADYSFPWHTLFATGGPASWTSPRKLKANFFRIQMDADAWKGVKVTRQTPCDSNQAHSNCTYLCATCPDTPDPDFHHSGYFGTINLYPKRARL